MELQRKFEWKEWELKTQELLKFCMEGKWEKVLNKFDKFPSLQNARLSASGETALHIAVRESTEVIVHRLVELIDKQSERRWQTPSALWIPNHRGNAPLHLAASIGNVGMCMCIAGRHEELLDLRNKAGETPLFLAALRGKKDAFLYLHQICGAERQYEYHRRDRDGQTILHVAIIGEYFDLAYQIICLYDGLIHVVDTKGYTPLHLLADKPAVFRSGCRLGGFISRIIYHCLNVEKLKAADYNFQPTCTDMHKHFSGDPEKDTEKYPENGRSINFFEPPLKMLQNMIKKPAINRENLPTPMKHMEANEGDIEDPKERKEKRSSNIEAKETPQLFPLKYRTSVTILGLIVHLIAWLFGLGDKRKKMQTMKEKNIWSVQIIARMLRNSSHYNSSSGCDPRLSLDFGDRYNLKDNDRHIVRWEEELILKQPSQGSMEQPTQARSEQPTQARSEQPTQGRESPILLAAKNGITEMVERILKGFPMAILDRDSNGRNTVLLAVESRQAKLYEYLVRNINFYESAFRAVDNNGNNALHLAARIGDYQPNPFAALQMQVEIKWFKYVKHSVPPDFFSGRNNENETPKEVFRKSHQDLVKEGGKWLINTCNSCSVVAKVVTTVAFATTATPPGGMKEGSTRPNLEHHPGFIVFAISSLIALSFSLTSVVSFLAIITPRHRPEDFEKQLPKKFLYALTFLFISLAAMLVCFCAGHFFLMRDDLEHNAFLVYGIACLPVAYFAMKQFPFFIDLVLFTALKAPRHNPSS